jgi:hypothetical protein
LIVTPETGQESKKGRGNSCQVRTPDAGALKNARQARRNATNPRLFSF